MNLLLVVPKYGVTIHDPCCFPLGFMYVSAVAKQLGHKVTVLNYNLPSCQEHRLPFHLMNQRFDWCLFTGFEEFRSSIEGMAATCRDYGVKTMVGGALATFAPREMLQVVDVVVMGESETTLERALVSDPGDVLLPPTRGPLPPMDSIPYPDYDGFGIWEYHKLHKIRYMGVLTSRGCPYSCAFCPQTVSFRLRPLNSVFLEIDHYRHNYALQFVSFNDNTLNVGGKQRWLDLCAGMKERALPWGGAIRADLFDGEMAVAAKDSGCRGLLVGIESFNQARLDKLQKRMSVQDITSCLDALDHAGIPYYGNILLGLPGDTFEDCIRECELIPSRYHPNVIPTMLRPFIGNRLSGPTAMSQEQLDFLDSMCRAIAKANHLHTYNPIPA